MLDAGQNTVWSTLSYETEDSIVIYSNPVEIRRGANDKSVLDFKIRKPEQTELQNGDTFNFNVSLSHLWHWTGKEKRSLSNMYSLEMLVYYDNQFLTLQSTTAIKKDPFSLTSTRNVTKESRVHIHIGTIWLLNNLHISFMFKFASPAHFFKESSYDGHVIIDFKYKTNLEKFNGTVNYTIGQLVPYKFKIHISSPALVQDQSSDHSDAPSRLTVPAFSMVFDDSNEDFMFCMRKISFSMRNATRCYLQKRGSVAWVSVSGIASVFAVDTTKRTVYGLNPGGTSYAKKDPLDLVFLQIEDADWIKIKDEPHVQKAKLAFSIDELPQTVKDPWIIRKGSSGIWAATRRYIFKKHSGIWTKVVQW